MNREAKRAWAKMLSVLTFLFFSLSLSPSALTSETEELPFIEVQPLELQPLGIVTPQQREEREFHRFVRGLEEYLGREEIVVEKGVYIEADSVFEIRYLTPDIPFRVSIANATEDELTLEEIKLYSPMRKPIFSQSLYRPLEPAGREIRQMKGLREEIRGIKEHARIQGRIALQERKALAEIYERRRRLLGEIRAKSAHTTTTVDLTPYLREVGNKATITVQEISIVSPNSVKPMGRDFARLRSLREEMRVLERRTLRQGRIALAQQKERFFKIQEERARVLSRIGKESSHSRAAVDLTPYLREVGDSIEAGAEG